MQEIKLTRGGRFLPYGYNVPTALEECYTWQTALQWLADNVKQIKEVVDNIDPGGEIDLSDVYRRLDAIDVEIASLGVQVANIPVYEMDATPTEGSENVVASNGIFEEFSSVDTSITTLQNTVQDLSDSLDALENSTSEDIEDITEMLTNITSDVTTLTNNVTSLTADMTNFQTALTALTGRVGSLETTVAQHTQDIADLGDDIAAVNQALAGKQNTLTFDNAPTENSNNPVTSDGIYGAIQDVIESIPPGAILDNTVTEQSANGVKSSGIYQYGEGIRSEIPDVTNLATKAEVSAVEAEIPDVSGLATKTELQAGLAGKQDELTFDNTPAENSGNPVTSDGIYNALTAVEQMIPDTSGLATKVELNNGLYGKQDKLTFDTTPTSGSDNPVTSGGVYNAIPNVSGLATKTELQDGLAGKQNTLTFDSEPTAGSNNPVTSDGIYDAINAVEQDIPDITDLATKTELQTGLAGKQNTLTFDTEPRLGSSNPVTSDGIKGAIGPITVFQGMTPQPSSLLVVNALAYIEGPDGLSDDNVPSAKLVNSYVNRVISNLNIPDVSNLATKSELSTGLSGKQDTLTFDNAPTANSNNPVKSGGIYSAINAVQQSIPDTSTLATKSELQTGLAGKQNTLTFDNTPTAGSNNPVTSDGIYDAIAEVEGDIPDVSNLATKAEVEAVEQDIPDVSGLATKTELQTGLAGKQNTLTFDNTPTQGSSNPVTSGGVYSAISAVEGDIPDVSTLATKTELQTGLAGKQNTLTFDTQPTQNSQNPVTSGGIYQYGEGIRSQIPSVSGFATTTQLNNGLASKQDVLTFDTEPTANSQNPVTSGGLYLALQNVQPSGGVELKDINHIISVRYISGSGYFNFGLKLVGNDNTYLVNTSTIVGDTFPGKRFLFGLHGDIILNIVNPSIGGSQATGNIRFKISMNGRSCGLVTNNHVNMYNRQYVEPGFLLTDYEVLENTLSMSGETSIQLTRLVLDMGLLFSDGSTRIGSASESEMQQESLFTIFFTLSSGSTTAELNMVDGVSTWSLVSDTIVCKELMS